MRHAHDRHSVSLRQRPSLALEVLWGGRSGYIDWPYAAVLLLWRVQSPEMRPGPRLAMHIGTAHVWACLASGGASFAPSGGVTFSGLAASASTEGNH